MTVAMNRMAERSKGVDSKLQPPNAITVKTLTQRWIRRENLVASRRSIVLNFFMRARKRMLLIVAIVVGVPAAPFLLFWPLMFRPELPPEPPVKSRFMGFTNGSAALFLISNYPPNE